MIMNKEDLKQYICSYLDTHQEEIIQTGEELLRMPELAYCENRTSALVGRHFEKLGLKQKTGLAITGRRADTDTQRPGPRLAILGELDALIVPQHPFADPQTHAAHACGHHAALNAMLGCAKVLTRPEVTNYLPNTKTTSMSPISSNSISML